jgi:hypothetical protein
MKQWPGITPGEPEMGIFPGPGFRAGKFTGKLPFIKNTL